MTARDRFRRRNRSQRQKQRRAIFLLPNLITTAALMLGFWSITEAIQGHWDRAAWGIVLAGVADSLDGRVARVTRSTSKFGVEYDSLSDVVSFGLAPALLVYNWALQPLGRRGWVIAALFAVCAALRLARFNVQKDQEEKLHFEGIASTVAGGSVAVGVWFVGWLGFQPPFEPLVGTAITASFTVLALLMVSSVPYPSWRNLPVSGRAAFPTLVGLVLAIVLLVLYTDPAFFAIVCIYLVSGPILWVMLVRRRRAERMADSLGSRSAESRAGGAGEPGDHGR
ncbi:MAG: CDP-diacylglycerol--serine O-phosphatidyltransferase [Deltaproteobacteria bacterium]|nr:CDP-diacylglycerol--serine O-phosphatidyltransferase [Deltaproteobacteria bacterium]MBW2415876.1 CDP-diacylglycerol--serine O-phosphatidyltransferase [Deltaproteobacteria bacterium]